MGNFSIYYLSSTNTADFKFYVGYTGRLLEKRLKEHICDSVRKKYNVSNWIRTSIQRGFEIQCHLIESGLTESNVCNREIYWIKKFREANINIVNGTDGGDGNPNPSREVRDKIRIARTGTKSSDETKNKIRKSGFKRRDSESTKEKKSRSISGIHAGRKLSKETVEKLKKSSIKHPVLQYSKSGDFIMEHESIADAHRKTKIHTSSIVACCNKNGYKSAGNFIWIYKTQNIIQNKIRPYTKNTCANKVLQYTMSGVLVNEFKSVSAAYASTNIPDTNIAKCCKGKHRHAGGFIWKYKTYIKRQCKKMKHKPKNGRHKKSVVQLSFEGKLLNKFDSISEATKNTSGHRAHIADCCKGRVRSAGGFKWKFEKDYQKSISN